MPDDNARPEPDADEPDSDFPSAASPERGLFVWFLIILGISIASLLWLSIRSQSPSYVRTALDFFFHATSGILVAYFAFRALFMYPFRMPDLFLIVIVLSAGLKLTLDVLSELSAIGLVSINFSEPERAGQAFQICLLVAGVQLAGAALGLRHCQLLKYESVAMRALTVFSGMMALPASAGIAGFVIAAISAMLQGNSEAAVLLMLLWFVSMIITGINAALFIRTSTLNAEVASHEKLAQK